MQRLPSAAHMHIAQVSCCVCQQDSAAQSADAAAPTLPVLLSPYLFLSVSVTRVPPFQLSLGEVLGARLSSHNSC